MELTLSDAEIKPYKSEPFLAQIFVSTQDKKDIIDNIRKDLILFVNNQCHYPELRLEVINTNPDDKKIIATSPIERFKVLMNIAPAINILKDSFKCEIKY